MPEKVFVAGANGFIGSMVCAELHRKGYEVHAYVRQSSEFGFIKPFVTKVTWGDLTDESSVPGILQTIKKNKIKKIISIVGSVDYGQDYETARKVNVRTARAIVSAAQILHQENHLNAFVFIGSVASRGFLENEPASAGEHINEKTSHYRKGVSIYCDVKHEAEESVLFAISRHNLPGILIEPGSLVGKGLGNTATTNSGLIRKIIRGYPVLSGGMSYASLSRVAGGIVLAMEKGKKGETYLLGGENLTMRDFAKLIRDLYQRDQGHMPFMHIPVIAIPREIAKILGRLRITVNEQQALLGSSYHYINSEKAMKELGYRHSIEDLKQAIMEELAPLKQA